MAVTPYSAKATHAAGGELQYTWLSDSTYAFFFKFYRDCSGAGAPGNNSVILCYNNTCNSTSGSTIMSRLTYLPDSTVNGSPVTDGCPGVGTRCTSTSSSIPGYEEWWYADTLTIPSRCDYWTFSVQIGNRNPSNNLVNAGSRRFYAEATLNNVNAQGNSSPYFSNKPVPSVCINQSYTYNNGGVDPNSDSLTFEMIRPLHAVNCPPTTSVIAFSSATPSYNLTTNPIQTGNSFSLDTTTGQMDFTPTQLGASTMSIRINEYRNGVKIGSVMRDIQVQVINCSVPTPIVNTVSNTISGATYVNGRVEACASVQMTFCYDLTSTDTAAKLVASDNSTASVPGASVTYTGQGTDSIRGCITWTPSTLDTGLRVFTVTASDTTCKSPGVIVSQTFVLPIYIWPVTDIIKDTTLCYGDSTTLTAVGGSNFTWSVISGGSPISSLSCTTCKTPIASPTQTTQYVVSNSATQYCSKNKDTATVTVLDIRTDTLSATASSPVCTGDTLNLYSSNAPTGYGYIWSGPNAFSSTVKNAIRPGIALADSGYYYLRSTKLHCRSYPDSVWVDVTPSPNKPNATSNSPVCAGDSINLTVTADTGVTFSWTGPKSFSDTAQNPSIVNTDSSYSGNYIVIVSKNGCTSEPDTASVVVNYIPAADTYAVVRPTTCGASNGIITLQGLEPSVGFSVFYKKNGVVQTPLNLSSNSSGEVSMTNLSAATYSEIRLVLNGCISDTMAPIILEDPLAPVISAGSNSPICNGDTLFLTATADSSAVVWAWSGPNSFNSNSQNPIIANAQVVNAGSYYVTATKNGCVSETDTVDVVINTYPAKPTAGSNSPVCTNDTLHLTANTVSGGVYSWTGPNSFSDTVQNASKLTTDTSESGDYIVTVTVNGCESEADTVAVVIKQSPTKTTASNNSPICEGDTLELMSTTVSGVTYVWTGPNGFTGTSEDTTVLNAVPVMSGDYTVSTLFDGCYSEPDTTTVTVHATPAVPNPSNNGPLCTGNTLILTTSLTSGVTYTWSGPNSFSSTLNTPTIVNVDTTHSGVYSVFATQNGCVSDSDTTIVTVNPLPAPVVDTFTIVHPTTCSGADGKIILSGLLPSTTYTVEYTINSSNISTSIATDTGGVLTINNLTAGQYTMITVTAPSGCSSVPINSIDLVDPTPPTIVFDSKLDPTTCGGTNGVITISGLDNNTSYTLAYLKNGISQTPVVISSNSSGYIIFSGLDAAMYDSINVIVNNCQSNYLALVRLEDPAKPVVTATNNTPKCEDSTFQLFGTADSTGVTWSWTGPNSFSSSQQNPLFNPAQPSHSGVYTLTATKNNCTSDADTTTVVVHPTPTTPVAGNNSPLCDSSTLNLTATSITGASYSWSGPKGFTDTVQNPVIANADTSLQGNYIVYVTVDGCNSLPDTTEVIIHHVPVIDTYSYTHPTTCNGTEGTITLTGLVADTTYSVNYLKHGVAQSASILSDNSGNVVITGLTAGIYTAINVTLNNCTSASIAFIRLEDPAKPVVTATNNTPKCEDSTFQLFGTADSTGVTWSWTGPNSYTSSQQNPLFNPAQPSHSGVYTLTATKNNCTSDADSTTVVVHPTPTTPVAGNNGPLCDSSTLNLTATSITGASYIWSGPKGFTDTVQNPVIVNADTSLQGNYIVYVTVNGCNSLPDTTEVIIHHIPVIDTYSYTHPTTCNGTEGTITLTGLVADTTYTVNYLKDGVSQSTTILSDNSGNVVMTGLTAGNYTAINVTLNNCTSTSIGFIRLDDPNAPVVTATNNTPKCEDSTFQLFGTADSTGVTWSWTGPNSYTSSQQNPLFNPAQPSHSGVYTLTATKNNCTSDADSTTVVVHPTPTTPVAGNNGPLCDSSTLNLTATSITGASYIWSGPKGFTDTVQNPVILNADTSLQGNYIVYVTVNGCNSLPDTTEVIIHHIPVIDTHSYTHPTTCNGTEGTITLTGLVADTTYNVNYLKDGIAQTPTGILSNNSGVVLITGLTQGLYTQLTVSLNGCVSDTLTPIDLIDPNAPVINAWNNTPKCEDSTFKLFASADSSSLFWSWTGPNSYTSNIQNPTITGAQPNMSGQYIVTATKNNCTSEPDTTTVIIHPTPTTPVAGNNGPLCDSSTLNLTSTSITGANYIWNGPKGFTDTVQNPVIANADTSLQGNYIVYVTVNGCNSLPDTTEVIIHHIPVIGTYSYTHPTTCNGTEGTITLTGLVPDTTYTVNYFKDGVAQSPVGVLSNNSGVVLLSGLSAGSYSRLTVMLNGCESDTVGVIDLVDPNAPVINAWNNTPKCEDSTFKLFASADSSSLFWSWTGPNSYTANIQNPTITGAQPNMSGQYIVTATKNNCTSEPDTTTVIIHPTPTTPVASNNGPLCAGSTLNLSSTFVTDATYTWTGPQAYNDTGQNPTIPNIDTSRRGNYIVFATANGCNSLTDTTEVIIHHIPVIDTYSYTHPTTCTGTEGTITLTGLVPDTTYTINYFKDGVGQSPVGILSDNSGEVLMSGLSAGNYTRLTVMLNGCESDTLDAILLEDPNAPVVTATNNTPKCEDSTFQLFGTADSSGVTWSWTGPNSFSSSTQNPIFNPAQPGQSGSYVLTATKNNCTSDPDTTAVIVHPTPVTTASSNSPICSGNTLLLTATLDTGGVYDWSGPKSFSDTSRTPAIFNADTSHSGDYIVTVTTNGCISVPDTVTVVVYPLPAPIVDSVVVVHPSTCNGTDGSITLKGLAANINYVLNYNLNGSPQGPINVTSSSSGQIAVTNLSKGIYTGMDVTSPNGCVSDTIPLIELTDPFNPTISIDTFYHPSTCGGSDGEIIIAGLESGITYTFVYERNRVLQTPVSLTADTAGKVSISNLFEDVYGEIYAARLNCTTNFVGDVILEDPDAPVISASNNTPVCELDTVFLTATSDSSGVTWSWTGPNSYTSTQQNPTILNAVPAQSGVYTVTATKNNCTSDPDTTTVIVHGTPGTPVAGSNSPVCSGDTLKLTASTISGANYSWSGPKGYRDTVQNPIVAISDTSMNGSYIVTAFINGCPSEPDTVDVTIYQTPAVDSFNYDNVSVCNGNDANIRLYGLVPNVAYTVNYLRNGIPQSASINSDGTGILTIPSLNAALYSQVSVILNGCPSDTLSPIDIIDPGAPVVTAGSDVEICEGDSIKLAATADSLGVTWSWTGPNSYTSTQQNPIILNGLPVQSGSYVVTATKNGCTSQPDSIDVIVHPTPATPVVNSNSPLCDGSTLFLSTPAITGARYLWSGPNSFTDTLRTPSILNASPSLSGVYSVVTYVNGCESLPGSGSVTIHPIPVIGGSSFSHPTTCGGTQGSITLTGLNNGTAYTVNYNRNGTPFNVNTVTNSSGQLTITGLPAGLYTGISVTLNNCTSDTVNFIQLNDPDAPIVNAAAAVNPICESDTLQLFGNADSSAVSWSWTGPNGFSSANQNPVINTIPVNQAGNYILTATKNNCTSDPDTVAITVTALPVVFASNNGSYCPGDTIQLTSTNINGATYSWKGVNSFTSNSMSPTIPNAQPGLSGDYIITVVANNCTSIPDTTTVVVHQTPNAPTAPLWTFYCEGETSSPLTATGLNLLWYTQATGGTGSTTAPSPSTTTPGVLTFYVSQTVNGCESPRAPTNVRIYPQPAPPVATPDSLEYCVGAPASQLTANGIGLKWYTQPFGGTFLPQPPTPLTTTPGPFNWYVSQTSADGCESNRDTVTVTVLPNIKADIITDKDSLCEFDTLALSDNNAGNPDLIQLWDIDGGNILGDKPGPYQVSWSTSGLKTIRLSYDSLDCDIPDTVSVFVKPVPNAEFTMADDICVGIETMVGAVYTEGISTYLWNFDQANILDSTQPGSYNIRWMFGGEKLVRLRVIADNGCISPEYTKNITVHEDPFAKIEFVSDEKVCKGDTVNLRAAYELDNKYVWRGNPVFIETNENEANAIVGTAGYAVVEVTNKWECFAADSTFFEAEPCCEIAMPNAFTPNNDGLNDIFYIITAGHHEISVFMIVNRWGEKVFQTNNQHEGWNGRYKGIPADIGTYNYYIRYKCSSGEFYEKKGDVILMR